MVKKQPCQVILQISSKQTVSLCYFMYANLTWLWPQHKKKQRLKQIQMKSSEGKPWVVEFNVIFTLKHTTHLKLFGNQGNTHKTALPARILRNDLRRVKGTDPNITEHPKYTSEQACPMETLPTALKVSASNILFPRQHRGNSQKSCVCALLCHTCFVSMWVSYNIVSVVIHNSTCCLGWNTF